MQRDHSLANRVASYRRADDPQSLQQAIEESLAESSLDGQDSDEQSDFELLAALPDEMAIAAVQQLCQLDNRPIGTQAEEPRWTRTVRRSGRRPAGPAPSRPPGRPRDGPGRLLSLVFVVFALRSRSVVARFGHRGHSGPDNAAKVPS